MASTAVSSKQLQTTGVSSGTYGDSGHVAQVTINAEGQIIAASSVALSATVTSVGMSVPSFLSIGGSPVTSAGTLALSLASQPANLGFFGPASGSAAPPTFRSMVNADFPSSLSPSITGLNLSGLTASQPVVTDGSKNLLSQSFSTFAGNISASGDVTGALNANLLSKINGLALSYTTVPGQLYQQDSRDDYRGIFSGGAAIGRVPVHHESERYLFQR